MEKVFVTRKIPDAGLSLLKKHCQVRVYQKDNTLPQKELLKGVQWCDALLCLLTDTIDKKVIDANPQLKIIANYAIGYNNIDVAYATQKNIPVTNTPGKAIQDAVAEHTFALMLAITKRIVEADTFTRQGKYKGWSPMLLQGMELVGKTLGIVGLGRIGEDVAQKAVIGMGMNVVYTDVRRNKNFEKKYKARFLSFAKLLQTSDVVSIHVPLLPSTHHLIGKTQFELMKKTAYLVNTSRGPVVDEKALVEALKRKTIAGAGLDVYEHEPELTSGLIRLKNVVLTPHIASATREARSQMAVDAVESILAVLKGKRPLRLVNPEIYKK